MDLNHLTIFLVVAEELHFGNAANRLHMAQPPVSRAIAQLERTLGTKLFDRSTRRVELTPAGAQIVTAARKVVDATTELKNTALSAQAGDIGQVDIVFAGVSTHKLIGELSRGLGRTYPGITPNFHSQRFAQDALDIVLNREADLVLGRWDFIPPNIESALVREEKLTLAVPIAHPLAHATEVSTKQLKHERFIELSVSHSVLRDRLIRLCNAAGFAPNIVQRASDTWTALALVAAEIGVMLTLNSVQSNVQDDNVRFIPVIDQITPIELRMAWLPGNSNPALPRTLEVAEDMWGLGRSTPVTPDPSPAMRDSGRATDVA